MAIKNLLLFWKAWPGGGFNCVQKMQLAGNDYRCILICMFACWKKSFAMQLLTANTFCKFCTIFRPQNGGWKMGPQNGARIWSPKWGPKMAPKRGALIFFWFIKKKDLQEIKALFKILDLPFWVPFLDPILGIKFWHHFWVHFSTSILGSKNGAKFAKVFAVKAA